MGTQRAEPPLHAASSVSLRKGSERQIGERLAAPERKRVRELITGPAEFADGQRFTPLLDEALETQQIELLGACADHVPRSVGYDSVATEQLAQLVDAHLERVHGALRRLLAPDAIDRAFAGDDLVRLEQEQRQ